MAGKRIEFREDLRTSSDYLRMAIPLMVQRQIPPTPYNYALWYVHVQNANPDLSKVLLEQFPSAGCYDPEKSESLFFEHIIKDYLPNSPDVQHLLVGMLAQLAQSVSKSAEGARDYGTTLKDAMEVLDLSIDEEQIQDVLGRLLAETVELEKRNKAFQEQLASASLEVERLRSELEESQQSARVDPLTKIANRRAFNDAILQSLSLPGAPTSLLLLDLDHFKRCNDTYGHPMGDRILQMFGSLLKGFESDTLFVARYGGEEFVVIVNEGISAARAIAEDIRHKAAGVRIRRKNSQEVISAVTVSIGVVQAWSGESVESLIERADQALYRAKDLGRNRVVVNEDRAGSPAPGGS
ncbi:GGDEF domain-containing protein [Thiorhodococcus fuscus]|uniref:diguanylate cyclase n=1 Tax=Thiorhodococcus fuscus TaxID=527200 RepID=A0ABW4Y615_9GAMM